VQGTGFIAKLPDVLLDDVSLDIANGQLAQSWG
jgi:hypothetical protein